MSTNSQHGSAEGRLSGSTPDIETYDIETSVAAPGQPAALAAPVVPAVPGVLRSLSSLKSLAPGYVEEKHKTYLDRLEAAVKDDKNLNIALSGPYGTGKSSVLEEFQKRHKRETVRLAISTLAPAEGQTSLTNRIQKELVKQLLYGAKPATQRNSRFSPISPVSKTRGALEGIGLVIALAVVLTFLGHLPMVAGTSGDHPDFQRAGAALLFAATLVVIYAALRVSIFNRFVISDMSAAGASVTLSNRTNTYFDEYLDEIVYFFDAEPKHIVILEDLDRFNDPHIFEALRELNTLLNNTAKRRKSGKSLRFVYAMRDSLFEKLGDDTEQERTKRDDAAVAENLRANRTKFFDIVIPVVPFISHRNSRELLSGLLEDSRITGIDRRLVALVAKHTTDMRLLVNMRNEYLVFAERLLESEKRAPGLSPSGLFALIAYKNFHMNDFEQIARQGSDLDALYDFRRTFVRTCVAQLERRKRELKTATARPRAMEPFAERMGQRLLVIGRFQVARSSWPSFQPWFAVASGSFGPDDVVTPEFWEAVADSRAIDLQAAQGRMLSPQHLTTANKQDLEELFPEALKDNRWVERVRDETATEIAAIDSSIRFLRGADFADLVAAREFRMSVGENEVPFSQRVDESLKSQLARDLVNGGYIDRNFALYAAQFYGDFTGVDVATFIVQNVQTNTMELDYQFDGPNSIANLLEESRDSDFLSTDAAFNIQVLDFLLVRHGTGGNAVVDHLIADRGDQLHQFLAAYFTSGAERGRLADALSRRKWLEVFTYLVTDEGVPDDVRADLVNAALLATGPEVPYAFGTDVADFVLANYRAMSAFTRPQNEATLRRIVGILEGAEVSLPELGALDGGLSRLVVDRDMYELTAGNLRTALGLGADHPIALDKVRENDVVYNYCLANPGAYLQAANRDPKTPHVLLTPETLANVLTDIDSLDKDEAWEADSVSTLLGAASSDCVLTRLADAPASTWRALAAAKLFRASLTNLDAYRAELGGIDEPLGELLVTAGAIETSVASEPVPLDTEDISMVKVAAAEALLNASAGIPSPEDRVQLADSLVLEEHLPSGAITAEPSNLFALLIKADLVPDDAATFSHLHAGGWRAVEPAILASPNVATFLQPDHIDGMVAEVLTTADTADTVGARVLSSLAAFQPTDDPSALKAAGEYAVETGTALPVDQIDRIATALHDADLTVGLLRIAEPPAGETLTILGKLGDKYTYLTTWEQDEFDVPGDDNYRAVFKALEDAGVCQTHRKQKNMRAYLLVKRP